MESATSLESIKKIKKIKTERTVALFPFCFMSLFGSGVWGMGWGGVERVVYSTKVPLQICFYRKERKRKKKVHGKERPKNLNTKQLFYYLRILKI